MLPQYMTATTTGVYRYRRRTPNELKEYISASEIIRSLGRDQAEAISKAMEINQAIDQSVLLVKMNMPSSVFYPLLSNVNLTGITDEQKNTKDTKSYLYASRLYLKQSNVTPMELSNRQYFFQQLLPSILKVLLKTDNPELSQLTYNVQLNIRDILIKLPKKNIQRYRNIDLPTLILGVHKGTLEIAKEDTTAIDTVNKSLKRIKSLLFFAQNSGLYSGIIPNMTIENKTQSRGQRKEFTQEELLIIEEALKDKPVYPIVNILRYTGMRTSELYKCSLSEIDGVLCFDLRSPTKALKTLSSHRIIPVHPNIKDSVQGFQELLKSYAEGYVTKAFTKTVQRHLKDTEGKVLYSLRHTFATNLIAKGVQPEIVSELMGHAHNTMTLNRYVKGFPTATLKSAIDTL